MANLVSDVLSAGGVIKPLLVDERFHKGAGFMNPSILVDDDGDILINLRHINYTLYHSEADQNFPTIWGPLAYLHPEHDQTLRTVNYLLRLDDELNIKNSTMVDTDELDVAPLWEFIGLEDARLVQWDGDIYQIGVRRDTTTNGQGRMELSKIEIDKDAWTAKEVSRVRIPAPGDDSSYCEKNWMPILDRPNKMVKWTSPTEVVEIGTTCSVDLLTPGKSLRWDLRGGSQVVPFNNYYVALVHQVDLFNSYRGQKDGIYRHRLVVWDKDFNLIGVSPKPISFLDARIEFCAGMAIHKDNVLITFGYQDNAAFILSAPLEFLDSMVTEALSYGA